jgi:hypothetical protein
VHALSRKCDPNLAYEYSGLLCPGIGQKNVGVFFTGGPLFLWLHKRAVGRDKARAVRYGEL